MIKMTRVYECAPEGLRKEQFDQLSRQIRFKLKAPLPLMSVGNVNALVWDGDAIMSRGHRGGL